MEIQQIADLVQQQRSFFDDGRTLDVQWRLQQLEAFGKAIQRNTPQISQALAEDLNKSPHESYLSEISMVLHEIAYHQRHLKRWARARHVLASRAQFPGRCWVQPEPYGVVLIIAPWNYPFLLSMQPLIGAISAGNTAVVKPSANAPAISAVIAQILAEAFVPAHVIAVQADRQTGNEMLQLGFDYIFFTGSVSAGRQVLQAGAKQLIPVTLELGGKSPVLVDQTADLQLAARRVAFGKVLNEGQTCVAPDYLLVHESQKEAFIEAFRAALDDFFPDKDYSKLPKIINQRQFERLTALLQDGVARSGGVLDAERRQMLPVALDQVDLNSRVMQEEIFGPILPVISYQTLEQAVKIIRSRPKPLALYVFTKDRSVWKQVLRQCQSGGCAINDVVLHLTNSRMPFGGVGESGLGNYHGRSSFDTFSHTRSVLKQSTRVDLSLRYPPYTQKKEKMAHRLLR